MTFVTEINYRTGFQSKCHLGGFIVVFKAFPLNKRITRLSRNTTLIVTISRHFNVTSIAPVCTPAETERKEL